MQVQHAGRWERGAEPAVVDPPVAERVAALAPTAASSTATPSTAKSAPADRAGAASTAETNAGSASGSAASASRLRLVRWSLRCLRLGPVLILAVLIVALGFSTSVFYTTQNIGNVL